MAGVPYPDAALHVIVLDEFLLTSLVLLTCLLFFHSLRYFILPCIVFTGQYKNAGQVPATANGRRSLPQRRSFCHRSRTLLTLFCY